jgi:hypothetical protein
MSHAALALLQGNVSGAVRHNPLVLVILPLLLFAIWDALDRTRLMRLARTVQRG